MRNWNKRARVTRTTTHRHITQYRILTRRKQKQVRLKNRTRANSHTYTHSLTHTYARKCFFFSLFILNIYQIWTQHEHPFLIRRFRMRWCTLYLMRTRAPIVCMEFDGKTRSSYAHIQNAPVDFHINISSFVPNDELMPVTHAQHTHRQTTNKYSRCDL